MNVKRFTARTSRDALALVRQGVEIADVRHRQFVPHITGPVLEERGHFAPEQRLVEIAGNW